MPRRFCYECYNNENNLKGEIAMTLKKIQLNHFTVFEQVDIEFSRGINVFIGDNGTGKTHVMKLIYSAFQAAKPKVSFPQKVVNTFKPDDYKISRLVSRKQGATTSEVKLIAEQDSSQKQLGMKFSTKTKKWEADVQAEETWERAFSAIESTFIPAKEILSNSYNLVSANEKDNVEFDDTYIDIIHSARINVSVGRDRAEKQAQLQRLETITKGKVFYDAKKERFYLKYGQSKVEFNLIAEGIRKIALLWQLIKNGVLEKGSILFWDEPEANINPIHIPLIVDMLLELQKQGVQIFISTHDYTLCKYLDIKGNAQENELMRFHSLYPTNHGVQCESGEAFICLQHNIIQHAFLQLCEYDTQIEPHH